MTRPITTLPGHSFPENSHKMAVSAGVGTFAKWLVSQVAPASKGLSLSRSE